MIRVYSVECKGATKETVEYANLKITISKTRVIESIEININDNLIMYLSNGGEPNPYGSSSPSFVVLRRMLTINPVNIRICI